ncbi:MAG: apolipoprotein N-acyltransferase [Treponema sp.]|nr:apolipoprotein N-acyltransferase [Treponema sp.]
MLSAAIPNEILDFGSPIIGLFSTIPLYIAINNAKTYKGAFAVCFIQATATHILSSFWLGNFQGYAEFTLGASAIGTGFVQAFMSLFFYFPMLYTKNKEKLETIANPESVLIPFRIIWFASVYTVWEWVKSTGFLGYPWGTVSMTAFRWSFITQIADITGPYGITFIFTFFAAVIGEGTTLIIRTTKFSSLKGSAIYKNTALACLALIFAANFYGAYEYFKPREQIKTLNAVLVQQNGDPWFKGEKASIQISQRLSEEKIEEMRKSGKTCDLVVWSEAILKKRFPSAQRYYDAFPEEEPLANFINRMDVPFIIGGPVTIDAEKHRYANSALLFDRNGKYSGSYQKMHLVPFAELIPGVENEEIRKMMKKYIGFSYGWYPGKIVTLFEIPISTTPKDSRTHKLISISGEHDSPTEIPPRPKKTVTIGTPICFDDTAAEVCRAMFLMGSEAFVNVTNDAWSKTDSAEIQHAVVAHYNAIEYRTTLARATNAGYTVVIGPNGKILSELPLFEEAALDAEIPIYKRQLTTYARFGNWLPIMLAILTGAYILFTSLRERKILI